MDGLHSLPSPPLFVLYVHNLVKKVKVFSYNLWNTFFLCNWIIICSGMALFHCIMEFLFIIIIIIITLTVTITITITIIVTVNVTITITVTVTVTITIIIIIIIIISKWLKSVIKIILQ